MGLDGTIKRPDGLALGEVAEVQEALASAFPGIVLARSPSGVEKIGAAAWQGVVFPEMIRRHFESSPARYGGDYEGPEFSAQFNLGSSETVRQVDVVLYGTIESSEPMFALLEARHGWITTFP